MLLFWKIGKKVYEKQWCYENVIEKYSNYYTYLYGNSTLFTRENIRYMKKFYCNFPVFYSRLESLSWEQYRLFLHIADKNERYFYFFISLLFNSNYEESLDLIDNNYYSRI